MIAHCGAALRVRASMVGKVVAVIVCILEGKTKAITYAPHRCAATATDSGSMQ